MYYSFEREEWIRQGQPGLGVAQNAVPAKAALGVSEESVAVIRSLHFRSQQEYVFVE